MSRLPLTPLLPTEGIDPHLRKRLDELLREYAIRINYATHLEVTNVAAATTVAHDLVLCSSGASTLVVSLLPALEFADRTMRIKKIDAGAGPVLVVPQSGETIDGAATYTISTRYVCLQVLSDGDNWHIV